MLPVGVVLCMMGQYWVYPPLAVIIATRRRGMLATMHCRHSTGISAHLSIRAWRSSPRFWGGLSILGYQGLPKHCEVWSYCLGSGSYYRNAAWQMALRCFAKCPWELTGKVSVRGHQERFIITVKSSPDVNQTTTNLDLIRLEPLLEVLTR